MMKYLKLLLPMIVIIELLGNYHFVFNRQATGVFSYSKKLQYGAKLKVLSIIPMKYQFMNNNDRFAGLFYCWQIDQQRPRQNGWLGEGFMVKHRGLAKQR